MTPLRAAKRIYQLRDETIRDNRKAIPMNSDDGCEINIRLATVADSRLVSDFVSTLTRKYIADSLEEGGLATLLSSMGEEETRERLLGEYRFFIAKQNEKVVGITAIKLPTHLYYLFVDSGKQRQGIGKRLFGHVVNWILARGGETITVNASINAIGAYRNFGFLPQGEIQNVDGVRFQPMTWQQKRPLN